MLLESMSTSGDHKENFVETAATLLQRMAEEGQLDAQMNLGQMYLDGQGFIQDDKKAAEWFLKAAAQDSRHTVQSRRDVHAWHWSL